MGHVGLLRMVRNCIPGHTAAGRIALYAVAFNFTNAGISSASNA